MRLTSVQLYNWRKDIESKFQEYPIEVQVVLQEYGICSNKPFFIPKFINMLCRGRNSAKFEYNNRRFLSIIEELAKKTKSNQPIIYFADALVNGLYRLKVVYAKQGSINTPKKVFLCPNVIASITLRKLGEFARSMKTKNFVEELQLMYTNDQKSKLLHHRNEQHKLAKAGAE